MYLSFDLFSFSVWRSPTNDTMFDIGSIIFWTSAIPDEDHKTFSGSLLLIGYSSDSAPQFVFDFLYIRGIIRLFRKQDNDIK